LSYLWILPFALGLGCLNSASDSDSPGASGDEAASDGDGGDDAGVDAAPDACAEPDDAAPVTRPPPPLPELPACDRACDRVLDCGVDECQGFEWATSARLQEICDHNCDDPLAEALLAADDCDAVMEEMFDAVGSLEARCEEDPCAPACGRLAECIVSECPGIGDDAELQIAADCKQNCEAWEPDWVLRVGACDEVVGPIADNDPGFRAKCFGERECPAPGPCRDYAAKMTRCVLEHCEQGAEDYEAGLEAALFTFCRDDAKCPAEDDLDWLLSGRVTCDSPSLEDVGRAPPLDRVCPGPGHLPADDAEVACERLLACPAMDWLDDLDVCMVYLALRGSAVEAAACIRQADACDARVACWEGG
jgi:hypothetical protein